MPYEAEDKTMGGMGEPPINAKLVSPSDTDELATISRALYVGGAGNIALVMASGDAVTFTGVLAGSFLPIRVKKIKSTLTTATYILNLY